MSSINSLIDENKEYELIIGKSFQNGSTASYHLLKYDFTPAAIDKNVDARVEIGVKNDVVIEVPHVEGSAEKFTQFIGNKQPSSTKDCVLIFNTKTKKFVLERLESNFSLKRNRLVSSSKPLNQSLPRSITPTLDKNAVKKSKIEANSEQTKAKEPPTAAPTADLTKSRSSFSNSNSSDKLSKNGTTAAPVKEKEPIPQNNNYAKPAKKDDMPAISINQETSKPISFIIDDLNLSGSDSDGSEL